MAIVVDKSGNYPDSVPPFDAAVADPNTGASASQVQGTGAAGASIVGNPIGVGGRGSTTAPTAVSSGQRTNLWTGLNGQVASFLTDATGSATVTILNPNSVGDSLTPAVNLIGAATVGFGFNGTSIDRLRTFPGVAATGLGVQAAGMVGQHLTTPPALTTGQYGRVQLSSRGRVLVETDDVGYETVAASASAQVLGATGAVGDLLASIIIVPATTSPGAVSITDGNGSAITIFTGGASSVANLAPITVTLGMRCTNATTPGWKVTTGANVSAIGIGNFT